MDSNLRLRHANKSDSGLLWKWANDAESRAASSSSEHISLLAHECWFREKLADDNSRIYIAMIDDEPIGQIRFDAVQDRAVVSVYVKDRGRGLGTMLICSGIKRFIREVGLKRFEATVKSSNIASLRAFSRAGFTPIDYDPAETPRLIRLILDVC